MQREPQPAKLFTIALDVPLRRRPGRGRYREHWQASVEAIGSDDPVGRRGADPALRHAAPPARRHAATTWSSTRSAAASAGPRTSRAAGVARRRTSTGSTRQRARRPRRARSASSTTTRRSRTRSGRRSTRRRRSATRSAPTCVERFAVVRARSRRGTASATTSSRRSCAGSTTTRARPGSSSARSRTRTRRSRAAAATTTSSRRSAVPRRPAWASARGSSAFCSRWRRRASTGREAAERSTSSSSLEPGAPRGSSPRWLAQLRAQGVAADTDYAGRSLKGQLTQAGRLGARRPSSSGADARRSDAPGRRRRGRHARRARREARSVTTWRDLMCGEPRGREHVGQTVTLAGWAARRRDHGGLVFVDLRDQTRRDASSSSTPSARPQRPRSRKDIRNEFVLRARGEVVARAPETVNPKMPTGEVELQVDELEIVSRSTPLPFQLDEEGVDETLRSATAGSTSAATKLQRNIRTARAARRRSSGRRWRPTASSTSRRRSWRSRPRRAHGTSSSRRGCSRASSSRCRSRRRSTSSCS